jgi:hypothetical protein
MTTDFLISPGLKKILYTKYSIVARFRMNKFDTDFKKFEKDLLSIKKDHFDTDERILIEHVDTDYYLKEFPYGINLYNLFTAFKQADIPLFVMLLFTSNFGIQREIELLAPNPSDRPTVVESFLTTTHYSQDYNDFPLAVEDITKPALCMMGQPRVHRHAMFNFLSEQDLLSCVAVSVSGNS